MRAPLVAVLIALVAAALFAPRAFAADPVPNPFEDWAAVFIAGDYRASTGAPSEVFDNGRKAMAEAFEKVGIPEENTMQFSVRPTRYPAESPLASEPTPINDAMISLTSRTKGGCLFFFTSHGTPDGVVMGERGVRPADLARMLDNTCGTRPTVAIISACFSGIFVPALEGPNRVVMTAARPDRTSFGCGEDDVYTFFDQCVLETLPTVAAFDALARETQTCVTRRETDLMVGPPSEPQVSIGAQMKLLLPILRLDRAAAPPGESPAV